MKNIPYEKTTLARLGRNVSSYMGRKYSSPPLQYSGAAFSQHPDASLHTFPLHFFKINLIYPSVFRTYKRGFPLRLPKKFVFISHFFFAFHLLRRNPNSLYDHLKQYTMKNRNFDNAMHRRFSIENQEVSMWNLRSRHVSFDKKSTISKKTVPRTTIQDEIYLLKILIHIL